MSVRPLGIDGDDDFGRQYSEDLFMIVPQYDMNLITQFRKGLYVMNYQWRTPKVEQRFRVRHTTRPSCGEDQTDHS